MVAIDFTATASVLCWTQSASLLKLGKIHQIKDFRALFPSAGPVAEWVSLGPCSRWRLRGAGSTFSSRDNFFHFSIFCHVRAPFVATSSVVAAHFLRRIFIICPYWTSLVVVVGMKSSSCSLVFRSLTPPPHNFFSRSSTSYPINVPLIVILSMLWNLK